MTCNLPPKVARSRGMSLPELALCITVLIAFVTLLILGAREWKRGDERANCVLTLRNMQVATRSYQNLHHYSFGANLNAGNGFRTISALLYEEGYIERRLYEQASGSLRCPSGGTYSCPHPETFPPKGQLYLKCSLAHDEGHEPDFHADW